MAEEKKKFIDSILYPVLFVILIWLIKIIEFLFGFDLTMLGLFPRSITGLIGIITFPLIHSNLDHLMSNTLPFLLLGTGIFYFYPNCSKKVITIIYIFTGIFVWLFARPAFHIGASGLIYGFASFLFFSGIIRRDTRSITLSLLVTFLYGGLIWGVLPLDNHVSWEGHLFGGMVGLISAFIFRKSDPYKKYDWEDEPDTEPDKKPEISYDNYDLFN